MLVPSSAMDAVRRLAPADTVVHGYRLHSRALTSRLLVRARLRSAAIAMERRVEVGAEVPVHAIQAMWCAPELSLNTAEADALLARLPTLTLAYWQRTGLDAVPVERFTERGVRVENSRGLTSLWVAQAALACVVAQSKAIPGMARGIVPPLAQHTRTFERTRVAVLGTGGIGREVGRLCTQLGMQVTGLSRRGADGTHASTEFAEVADARRDLLRAAAAADFLVLAVPLTDENRRSIGREVLQALGHAGTLVNLARPGLVDQHEMILALRSGELGAAYVSRLEGRAISRRWHAVRTPSLFLLHDREAHVAEKEAEAARQFISILAEHDLRREAART